MLGELKQWVAEMKGFGDPESSGWVRHLDEGSPIFGTGEVVKDPPIIWIKQIATHGYPDGEVSVRLELSAVYGATEIHTPEGVQFSSDTLIEGLFSTLGWMNYPREAQRSFEAQGWSDTMATVRLWVGMDTVEGDYERISHEIAEVLRHEYEHMYQRVDLDDFEESLEGLRTLPDDERAVATKAMVEFNKKKLRGPYLYETTGVVRTKAHKARELARSRHGQSAKSRAFIKGLWSHNEVQALVSGLHTRARRLREPLATLLAERIKESRKKYADEVPEEDFVEWEERVYAYAHQRYPDAMSPSEVDRRPRKRVSRERKALLPKRGSSVQSVEDLFKPNPKRPKKVKKLPVRPLITKARKLWDKYLERPTKLNFQTFVKHRELMISQMKLHSSKMLLKEVRGAEPVVAIGMERHYKKRKSATGPKTKKKESGPSRRNPKA